MTNRKDAEARAREVLESVEWQQSNFMPREGETGAQCRERRLVEAIADALSEAQKEVIERAVTRVQQRAGRWSSCQEDASFTSLADECKIIEAAIRKLGDPVEGEGL